MALVDYSSSSTASDNADGESGPPPAKRRKDSGSPLPKSGAESATRAIDGDAAPDDHKADKALGVDGVDGGSDMPPLPASFHDLYASGVRQSVGDDPSLHQGRKRQTPHVVGRWPSHLYVEWHPDKAQHDMLAELIQDVAQEMTEKVKVHSFLSSDLGAPLPLHISLSRPITLSTGEKDLFLERVEGTLKGMGLGPFTVSPKGLAWYKSPDSDRSFLILRVTSNSTPNDRVAPNPELMALLNRCNSVVSSFDQPTLYQRTSKDPVGTAFHISIGWTLGLSTDDEVSLKALYLFRQEKFSAMKSWKVDVNAVKAKIGNVVNHIPLSGTGPAEAGHKEGAAWLLDR